MSQITIRNMDPLLEKVIRQRAKARHTSLSDVANELIRQALNLDTDAGKKRNLQEFCGVWTEQEAIDFARVQKSFEGIDEDLLEMKLMLDTNAWAAICAGAPGPLVEKLEAADEVFLPVTVLGELFAGFLQGSRNDANVALLNQFLAQPGVSVADNDRAVAEKYGLLVKNLKIAGTPIPTNDIWIAAAALCLSASLISRDRHFAVITGLDVISF